MLSYILTLFDPYSFGVILLCRPTSTGDGAASDFWGDRPKAMAAANETTRVMEDILSTPLVRLCQIHTFVFDQNCLFGDL